MSAASWYAVTRFNVATFGANARAQGVPPFALTYFTDVLSGLLTEAREAAEAVSNRAALDAACEALSRDPDVVALLKGDEP